MYLKMTFLPSDSIKISLCLFECVAPAKKAAAPPPPPPPPPTEEQKDVPAADEAEEEQFLEFMGYQIKVPKMPQMPDWLRVIVEYRFPSSIDPFTGETLLRAPEFHQHAIVHS